MSDQGTAAVPVFAPRKLVVCCDGTWNEPYQIGNPTNVVKMVRAVLPKDVNEVTQLVYYHPGVGTGNIVDRFIGGTLGVGLAKNVQSAYDVLASNYVNGDKIYLFGFSRGAYTARALAGLIGKVGGLLQKGDMDLFPYVWDIYRDKVHRDALGTKNEAKIEAAVRAVHGEQKLGKNFRRLIDALSAAQPAPIFFIGVWDTVGALGVPGGGLRKIGQSLYDFHDTELSERVHYAYHALAIDERRKNFEPTLWTRPKGRATLPNAQPQTLEQVWFAGVHSNVGGGYPDCGLSDIAFLWMVDKAKEAQGRDPAYLPLAFDESYLKDKTEQTMGLLEDSGKKIFWKWLGLRDRAVMAPVAPDPATGKERETCEYIHWSAWFRLQCTGKDQFAPFPYAPDNLRDAVKRNAAAVTKLSSLERLYRKWPDVNPPVPPTA
jgi:uncharacterized protein (DUF2235 family)